MKRLLIPVICIFAYISSVSAQTPIKEMDNADTRFIPGAYMKNGEAAIYFSEDEYGYDGNSEYTAEIYDFNLNPLKTFSFQRLTPYTKTESRKSTGNMEKTANRSYEEGAYYGDIPSVSDMDKRKEWYIQKVYNRDAALDKTITLESLTSNTSIKNDTVFIDISASYYKNGYYDQYLKSAFMYFAPSNKWGYYFCYGVTVPVFNGEWETSTSYDTQVGNLCVGRYYDVENLNHWNGGLYLPFSQTFFNDDDKFEYVRYNAEISEGGGYTFINPDSALKDLFGITDNDRDGDGLEDYRSTYYGIHYKGLEVVSEDGNVIYNFPIPNNCDGSIDIRFYKSVNNILAQAEYRWDDTERNPMKTTKFYRIDKTTGIMNVVKEETRMCVGPNPATQGTSITINMPSNINGNSSVSVTSANGIQMYHKSIEPNTPQVLIPTANLNSGMYIFTISTNGNVVESSKIFIK